MSLKIFQFWISLDMIGFGLDLIGMHVGSVLIGVGPEVVLRVCAGALLLPESEEEKPKLSVERQIDPRVHNAVQGQKPKKPNYRVRWKKKMSFKKSFRYFVFGQVRQFFLHANHLLISTLDSIHSFKNVEMGFYLFSISTPPIFRISTDFYPCFNRNE